VADGMGCCISRGLFQDLRSRAGTTYGLSSFFGEGKSLRQRSQQPSESECLKAVTNSELTVHALIVHLHPGCRWSRRDPRRRCAWRMPRRHVRSAPSRRDTQPARPHARCAERCPRRAEPTALFPGGKSFGSAERRPAALAADTSESAPFRGTAAPTSAIRPRVEGRGSCRYSAWATVSVVMVGSASWSRVFPGCIIDRPATFLPDTISIPSRRVQPDLRPENCFVGKIVRPPR
jgi:hypothetical protein